MKIRTKLILAFLILTLVTAFIAGVNTYLSTNKILKDIIDQNEIRIAQHLLENIDRSIFERFKDLQTIAESHTLTQAITKKVSLVDGENRLTEYATSTGPWDLLLVADKEGNIILSTYSDLEGKILNATDYPYNFIAFNEALKGKTYYSDLVISKITNKPTLVFASPLLDIASKQIVGVAIGQFLWDDALTILVEQKVDTKKLGAQTEMHLLNKNGYLLGENNPEENDEILLKQYMPPTDLAKKFLPPAGASTSKDMKVNFTALTSYAFSQGYKDYKGNGWLLIMDTPTKIAFAGAAIQSLQEAATTALLLLVFCSLVFFFINYLIINPIKQITGATKKIAAGDFKTKVNIKRSDEIGALADSFNYMTKQLKESRGDIEAKVETRTKELEQKTAELEKMNKFMVGRELKMVELKEELKKLQAKK